MKILTIDPKTPDGNEVNILRYNKSSKSFGFGAFYYTMFNYLFVDILKKEYWRDWGGMVNAVFIVRCSIYIGKFFRKNFKKRY